MDHALVDRELRAHTERGDLDAAATHLLRAYGDELGGYLAAVAASPDDAAEAYAQLCEDLWRGLPGFAFRASARTWLYTLARHALARHARDPRRRRERNLPLSVVADVERAASQLRARTEAHRRTTMKDRVRALRDRLDAEERELLILRVDRGLEWQEVAEVLAPDDDGGARKRRATALRKRFERLKERLREMAVTEGLLPAHGERD